MHLPEVPHEFDMYAQRNIAMDRFREQAIPWLDSLNSPEGKGLVKELKPLARLLLKEPAPDEIPDKYAYPFEFSHDFADEQIALGARHIGNLIGLGLREQAIAISKNKQFITPVLPANFAVSHHLGNDVLLARGTNSLVAVNPDLEAKLAWRVHFPESKDARRARLTLVSRRILPLRTKITMLRGEIGLPD